VRSYQGPARRLASAVDVGNRIAEQLIRDGRVPVPGIGIVAASEDEATRLGIDGIIIVRTLPPSPAAKAGLEGAANDGGVVQDVITAANDQPVHSMSDLANILEEVGVGNTVKLTGARGGRSRSVDVTVGDTSRQLALADTRPSAEFAPRASIACTRGRSGAGQHAQIPRFQASRPSCSALSV
jgi:S1-C subfamily serine protease